jgi:aquaporin Z
MAGRHAGAEREAFMQLVRRCGAEFLGTFWLVFGGCGAAVLAAAYPVLGIGFLGVSLAFGLTVLTGAYALAHVSGAHFNPAVSLGLWVGGRFPLKDLVPYVVAQVLGAIGGAAVLYLVASGAPLFSVGGFASNGYGAHSPGLYPLGSALAMEAVMTFFFVLVIMGATDKRAPAGLAPLAIGFALALIHLVSIPVTNTSVNPARSTGPALIAGGWALEQLWAFWVAPLVGAAVAGVVYRLVAGEKASAVAASLGAKPARRGRR